MVDNSISGNAIASNSIQNNKPSKSSVVAGLMGGYVANYYIKKSISSVAGVPFNKGVENVVSQFSLGGKLSDKIPFFQQAIKDAFTKSNLSGKGVKIVEATLENSPKICEMWLNTSPKWIKSLVNKFPLFGLGFRSVFDAQVSFANKGLNAFYIPKKAKSIIINSEKNPLLAFHEIGHGINYNTKCFGNILSKLKSPMLKAAGLITLVALCKRKKQEGEKPKGVFDKVTTFIKNNCGKLAFLCAVPTIAEEGLATLKGLKLAKSAGLSEKMLKQVKMLNIKGWFTYIAMGLALGLGAKVASKVKDSISKFGIKNS